MISVAGTVFAITIAAVVYASGNYGPRLLTNFMTDRGNQLSLGVFIADFVYCVMVLRTIRQPDETGSFAGFVPELSLLVALGLTLLSVAVLVYFLHHVPDSIRINNVVAGVGHRLMDGVEKRYPDPDKGEPDWPAFPDEGFAIRAIRSGYIEIIDFETLAAACKEHEITVTLQIRPGDFIHPAMPLMTIQGMKQKDFEEIDGDLRSAFSIAASRTPSQDIEYSIDELVEIALRALSPGINDPFTAITCIHWLAAATASLASRDLRRDPEHRDYGQDGVHALRDDFDHFLKRGFGSVRASAASDAIVSRIFIESLAAVSTSCKARDRRESLLREAGLLLAQARTVLKGPTLDELEATVQTFEGRIENPA